MSSLFVGIFATLTSVALMGVVVAMGVEMWDDVREGDPFAVVMFAASAVLGLLVLLMPIAAWLL